MTTDPAALVQQQLDAYNARDVDAWLATYAEDAEQYTLHGDLLARGHAQMRARIQVRFAEPGLHARLLSRTVMPTGTAAVVVDFEELTRSFPQGPGTVEMLCIYEVAAGRIRKVSFVMGEPRLDGNRA
ncbi:hypothetical protein BurJ1DRAFT_4881 [Burkholderiales bacterium JOSHI_001]|nr:hypothetical protein BurJ1DRAFT_4881 [Burkholderiales bacterium JOSHI_001]